MKNLFNNIYFFVLFLFFNAVGYAQLYPVQLTPVFNSPYSVKISDYATSMDMKMQLLINPTDISISQRRVRLKLYIQGNGLNIQTSDYAQEQRPIYINGGELQTLTNVDIASLFRLENLQGISAAQYANPLPEGMYNFCFEMYDFVTNQKISQKSCASLYLILNDPPLLNTPQKNEQIASTEFPNILFTWTPRQINATNVSYKFELKQLLDPTLDPQIGFQMSPTLYEETLFSTAVLYNLSMPILTPGLRYAWRVRAISTTGLSENAVFKNDGYSEIYSFKYTASCTAPTFLLSESQSSKSVKITWEGVPEHTRYQVQYKKQGVRNAQWFSSNSLNKQSLITNLEPGVTYEFRVGSSCDPAEDGIQSFTYSNISTFTTPTESSGVPAYNCGIVPQINIQNQKPLTNLIQSETFRAGDFPVTILELRGENSPYSGRGYIVVPYLGDTKIAVEFNSIVINTDYQLISGIVETSYNPDWKNVVGVKPDPLVEEIFGPQGETDTVVDNDNEIVTNIDDEPRGADDDTNPNTGSDTDTVANPIVNLDPGNSENPENPNNPVSTKDENPIVENSNNTENSEKDKNDYFIIFKGKKYKNGEKIQIPFKRNLLGHNRFKMGELDKEINVKYELAFQSEKANRLEKVEGNNYLKKMESKKEADFDFSIDNTLKYQLKSAADTDSKPNLSNEINLIVKPFKINTLEVIDVSDEDRVASNGEILYYVTKPGVSRNTKFQISNSPNLAVDEIPEQNIKWKFNDIDVESKNGLLRFSQKIGNDKDIKVEAFAGYPNLLSKTANVEWVTSYTVQYEVVTPAVKTLLTKLGDYVNNIGSVLRTLDNTGKLVFNINYQGQQSVEEDSLSRFYNIKREGGFGGSIDLEFKGFKYGVDLKIAVAQIYLKPVISLSTNSKMLSVRRNDKTTFTDNGTVMNFALQADLKVGGEIGFDVKLIKIKAEPYAGISSWGQLSYFDKTKTVEGALGVGKPYVGIKGEVTLGDYDLLPGGDLKHTWEDLKIEKSFKHVIK